MATKSSGKKKSKRSSSSKTTAHHHYHYDIYDRNDDDDDEEGEEKEFEPLYKGQMFKSEIAQKRKKLMGRGGLLLTVLVLLLGGFVLTLDKRESKASRNRTQAGKTSPKKERTNHKDKNIDQCPSICRARSEQRKKHFDAFDLRQTSEMVKSVEQQTQLLQQELQRHQKYGKEYYEKVFAPDKKFRGGIISGSTAEDKAEAGLSQTRFQRKLQIKLLEIQSSIVAENQDLLGQCNCNEETPQGVEGTETGEGSQNTTRHQRQRLRQLEANNSTKTTITLPTVPSFYTKFVWATGGHSAAAGRGNLFNESYTSFLERAARPVFESVGIQFEARNYAMSGMPSGPEIALCQEAIFGIDADLITWDFATTNGTRTSTDLLYAHRIGMHLNRPAALYIRAEHKDEMEFLKQVEEEGLTALYVDSKTIRAMKEALPDMFGLSHEQMAKVPEFVRHFRCQDKWEDGDPTCADEKYSKFLCKDRKYQEHGKSSDPGWRMNALYGYHLALWLIESLKEALVSLGEVQDPAAKLEELRGQEQADTDKFQSTPFPENPVPQLMEEDAISFDVKPSLLHRAPVICHTALMPSETRRRRILFGTDRSVNGNPPVKESFRMTPDAPSSMFHGQMRLTRLPEELQAKCSAKLKADFQDAFYTFDVDGTTSLILPNAKEIEVYGREGFTPRGILILCFVIKYQQDGYSKWEMKIKDFEEGNFELSVNGEVVTELVKLDYCSIMKHKDGYNFAADENGQYEVKASVKKVWNDGTSILRISSFILL